MGKETFPVYFLERRDCMLTSQVCHAHKCVLGKFNLAWSGILNVIRRLVCEMEIALTNGAVETQKIQKKWIVMLIVMKCWKSCFLKKQKHLKRSLYSMAIFEYTCCTYYTYEIPNCSLKVYDHNNAVLSIIKRFYIYLATGKK